MNSTYIYVNVQSNTGSTYKLLESSNNHSSQIKFFSIKSHKIAMIINVNQAHDFTLDFCT